MTKGKIDRFAKFYYTVQISYFESGSLFVCNMYLDPRGKNQLPQTNLIRNLPRNKMSTANKPIKSLEFDSVKRVGGQNEEGVDTHSAITSKIKIIADHLISVR